jgi:transposase InsO family protein
MVTALGVEAITGRPGKPTTQGKNERVHQTLYRYLDKQPVAKDLAELQVQLETFGAYDNKERPHQGPDGKTPQEAWDALPAALPPTPPDPIRPAKSQGKSQGKRPGRWKSSRIAATSMSSG